MPGCLTSKCWVALGWVDGGSFFAGRTSSSCKRKVVTSSRGSAPRRSVSMLRTGSGTGLLPVSHAREKPAGHPSSFCLLLLILPDTLLFQRVGDLARHLGLIMLGQHRVGPERPGGLQHAIRHHALPLPEQVRQKALVAHRHARLPIAALERYGL